MSDANDNPAEYYDVLIVGAGISGIGMAHHLEKFCPGKRYAVLEARAEIGGTWDLFRYPGVRSDSDMFTLGFGLHPWRDDRVISDGPSIKRYLVDTAKQYGIDRHIRFNTSVEDMAFDTARARWTVNVKTPDGDKQYACNFLLMCTGYYRYSAGYTPDFPGADDFKGDIIHPQLWPENYDYAGKNVVIIGSGATAVTLLPAMTDEAAHVTMLQRSPTWYFNLPERSNAIPVMSKFMPRSWAFRLLRWYRIVQQQVIYKLIRARPKASGDSLFKLAQEQLPPGYDAQTHFRPHYAPWDQRLCVVPDGDLFKAICDGKASVVTDHIERFVEDGILLKSGERLKAEIIITATGLALEAMGGATASVDGRAVDLGHTFHYRGLMLSDVPNASFFFGYINSSWTLRADLIARYFCRLLNYMDEKGYDIATPVNDDPTLKPEPVVNLSAGYVTRVADKLPKQGDRAPWRNPQSYFNDVAALRFGRIDDGVMKFSRRAAAASDARASAEKLAAE